MPTPNTFAPCPHCGLPNRTAWVKCPYCLRVVDHRPAPAPLPTDVGHAAFWMQANSTQKAGLPWWIFVDATPEEDAERAAAAWT